mmetsp:Transcript_75078/g.119379  ORF Transcript_75078/g.119379 Transcript_75078/m.119379 type:complete len:156 (-) Transcript_75078:49-516(-)|eukprot:CAMPEP_0197023238 /NCGR_PEP_ID=MMETSP1384-20130603/3997_1 /TAXON_ID=29189 /ORGANISM="Ammonia sp." /LENGTH=155 /DNA_ID=CAMNT_0042451429 /DNA_START=1035 /DNA_END=1502 /DNA_ORIENTATION=+
MAQQQFTPASDPFPRVTEHDKAHIPTAQSPAKKAAEEKEEQDILPAVVIKEFDEENLAMPKQTEKVKETEAYKVGTDKTVLVEWSPPKEKAVHDKAKDDKVFVKWSKNDETAKNEDLQNLEQEYLDTQKLEKEAQTKSKSDENDLDENGANDADK